LPGLAVTPGTIVSARVVSAVGADLIAEPLAAHRARNVGSVSVGTP